MNQRPLAEFVTPTGPSTATLNSEWHEVRRRVRRHRQARVAGGAAMVLVLAGVVAAIAVRSSRETMVPGVAVAALDTPKNVWLTEGSQVAVTPQSELSLVSESDSDVLLLLERGAATFDVEKKPSRKFVVKADSVEVKVVGTRFTVQRNEREVHVSVERGIVEVRDGETVTRLTAGRHWARTVAPAPVPVAPVVEPEPVQLPTTDSTHHPDQLPRGGEGVRGVKRLKPVVEGAAPTPEPEVIPEPLPPAPEPTEPSPADVFAEAMRERAAGNTKVAMQSFHQLSERWPQSAYAPMSAFEWGRLALDAADDPKQAARAFERTLELATSPQLIEDALARLAEAYARYDAASCRRVQGEYLRRFPGGPHARGVSKACPP